jgi:serine/threonine protein kinase
MVHLHERGVVHGDLKARNVLLKSGSAEPVGLGGGWGWELPAGRSSWLRGWRRPGRWRCCWGQQRRERLGRSCLQRHEAAARSNSSCTPAAAAAAQGRLLTAKVADFGLSQHLEQSDGSRSWQGTLSHMAPEIMAAGQVGGSSSGSREWRPCTARTRPLAEETAHTAEAWLRSLSSLSAPVPWRACLARRCRAPRTSTPSASWCGSCTPGSAPTRACGARSCVVSCGPWRPACCTALHCTALHCTALHCTALHCTAPHCTALHCAARQPACSWL